MQISENQRLGCEGFPFFFAAMNTPFEPLDPRWKDWVEQHENEDPAGLALRYTGKPGIPLRFLLQQVKGRQIASHKLPTWYRSTDIIYPDTLSLEQCSSEATARYKLQFVRGMAVADLTGGLGIDTWAFSEAAGSVLYNEPDKERLLVAQHNLGKLGRTNVQFQQSTAEAALHQGLAPGTELVYLDPSRRTETGRKVFLLQDLQPDVLGLKKNILEQVGRLLIKLSPMLDLHEGLRLLPETTRVDILSWKGECREMLFHLQRNTSEQLKNLRIFCTELESGLPDFDFHFGENLDSSVPTGKPKTWLYEPHASVRKAGGWPQLCEYFALEALHPNTHLFTSEKREKEFPGRRFRILDILPYRPMEILNRLQGRPARMVFYNFPRPAKQVIEQLHIPSGEPLWLFFATLNDGHPMVILSEKEG